MRGSIDRGQQIYNIQSRQCCHYAVIDEAKYRIVVR